MARQSLPLPQALALIALATALQAFAAGASLVPELDRLHSEGRLDEIVKLVPPDTQDPEFLWRLARAMSELIADAPDEATRRRLAAGAETAALRAKELAPHNAKVRLCVAIVLGRTALLEPPNKKFAAAGRIRSEVQTSLALDSTDPVAWLVLGRWHYEVASLNGWLRLIAEAAFGERLPAASHDRALECFTNASSLDRRAVAPRVEAGRTLIALGRTVEGREMLSSAIAMKARNREDEDAIRRAREALERTGAGGPPL